MIDYRYTFNLENRDEEQLAAELRTLNIETPLVIGGSGGIVQVIAERPLTGSEYDSVARCVASHIPSPAFAAQRDVQNAVVGLLQTTDPATRALMKILEVTQTRANDLAELLLKVLTWAITQPGFPAFVGNEQEYARSLFTNPRLTQEIIRRRVAEMMIKEQTQPAATIRPADNP